MAAFLGSLGALAVAGATGWALHRWLIGVLVDRAVSRLLKEPYPENLWDLAVGFTRVPPHTTLEIKLRAQFGEVLERPLGGVRRGPGFDRLAFSPAQVHRPPLGPQDPVDLAVTIGPRASRPLRLPMPILVAAMGYGVALAKPYALAILRGANRAGAGYNAGSGPVLDEVLREARHLILQYAGGAWTRDPAVLAQADAIEIRYGHGGRAGIGRVIPAAELPPEARELMQVPPGGQAVFEAPLPGAATPQELRRLVPRLRKLIRGGPVGVKLAAGHDLERDMAAALDAGVDFIALDGAQGGTHGAPPIICDDFGIPTVHALHRAVQFLERTGARREVSLLVGGGLLTPGDVLKALALGADAAYLGTAVLFAADQGQEWRTIPYEPIVQMAWAMGKHARQFDPDQGATAVANYLKSCAAELAEACRALGKRSVQEVSRDDLVALDRETAATLGIQPSWRPPRA